MVSFGGLTKKLFIAPLFIAIIKEGKEINSNLVEVVYPFRPLLLKTDRGISCTFKNIIAGTDRGIFSFFQNESTHFMVL